MADQLPADLDAARAAAGPRIGPFARIEYFPEVDSTNDVALARASSGAPHGLVILADAQRAGRGRRGRAWHSPADAGVYLSVVLRPLAWADALSLVTLAAGVAVVQGLRATTGLALELKWPNDVVIGRPWRKVAGILSESASTTSTVDAVVVGIGVNLRRSALPPDVARRATALESELGREVDRASCVMEILCALAGVLGRLERGERQWVLAEWRRLGAAGLGGAPVRWNDGQGTRRGLARDIDDSGALLVDTGTGGVERLVAGEVFWERLGVE